MPRRAKIALVAVVLIGGLVSAWRFRKPHGAKSTPSADAAIAQSTSPSTAPAIAQDTMPLSNAEPAAAPQTQPSAPPLDLAAPQTTSAGSAIHNLAAMPPPEAEPKSEPAMTQSSACPAAAKVAEDNPWHTAPGSSTPAGSQPMMPEAPPNFAGAVRRDSGDVSGGQDDPLPVGTPLQTHKIVDGDSLPLLAERYLGAAARANEIFACNRDVLSDPEVLPIGVRLRIPVGVAQSQPADGRQAPPVSDRPVTISTAQQSVSSTAAAVESTLPTTLARVNPPSTIAASTNVTSSDPGSTAPLLSIGSGGLSPLPPFSGSEHSTGKIYIVQNGDTLPGIAQKLYGDSARTDQLLQANREQLSTAQDLHPGMILETP
jgi:nucleoid-associated protein YgaU